MKTIHIIRNRILHGLLILLASGLHAEPPKQDSPAFTLTAKGPSNRGAFVVGYRFALESAGKITALGLVDQNGDGKLQGTTPVEVALWTPAGQELARVQIPLSTAATNGVFLVGIPPVSLPVGKYVIGALTEPSGEAFFFDTKVAASPGVVWEEGLFLPRRSLVMPTMSRPDNRASTSRDRNVKSRSTSRRSVISVPRQTVSHSPSMSAPPTRTSPRVHSRSHFEAGS